MKLGKADSLGRRKGFLLLFTFLGSERRGEEEAAVVILGWGMERCITVNSSYLGAQDLPPLFPPLKIIAENSALHSIHFAVSGKFS